MNDSIKRLRAWILGPKSDFVLFVVVLVLANLVGAKAFFRLDLTANRAYSLSEASRRAVKTLEEPLSVKVFFTANLPAPYNSVERYLSDLLVEYKGVGNRRFSFDFFDMELPENKDLAEACGIQPVQIQEVKNDEVGIKNAYMGLAIIYGDAIEPVNDITGADGLEYRLTTTMEKLKSTANTLSGLSDKVKVTLYASTSLNVFRIQGYKDLNKAVKDAFDRVNSKQRNKMEFSFVDSVDPSAVEGLVDRFGLQKITWAKQQGEEAGTGVLGIALEYGDRVRTIQIALVRELLGGYGLAGLDGLDQRLTEALQALVSNSLTIGYLTGHGERSLYDPQQGAASLMRLVSDRYELKEIDLSNEDLPANLAAVIINGPRSRYAEDELYKLDQFLMRGGSVLALLDPFDEQLPQGNAMFGGGQPSYVPVETGLERLLEKYGVAPARNYVLDSESFVSRQRGQPDMPLYYAPIIGKKGLDRSNAISRNLSSVIFLKAGELKVSAPESLEGRKATALVTSSTEAWTVSERINLQPFAMFKPGKDQLAVRNLAVLLEGRFPSAFDKAPGIAAAGDSLSADAHLGRSVQNGRLVVVGTSEIAGPMLLDEEGRQPVAILLRNAIDYLAGNEELNDMRTKGLSLNPLDKTPPAVRLAAKTFNQYGLPLLVAAAGLLAWRLRIRKRTKIQAFYAEK
jgi:ABC-type uncharacterized transport system involved in gliding motility auxiliary subunit